MAAPTTSVIWALLIISFTVVASDILQTEYDAQSTGQIKDKKTGNGHKTVLSTVYDAEVAGQIARGSRTNTENTHRIVKRQTCEATRFRTIDGTCNNAIHTAWGSANQNFRRILPAVYDDGVGTPRVKAVSGSPLPNARTISNNVHFELDRTSRRLNVMAMQWGQFLDHDLTGTPVTTNNGEKIECCTSVENTPTNPACFPISIPPGDSTFTTRTCMNFVRSEPADVETGAPREQKNSLTAFIDGSQIYGANSELAEKLKDATGGLLEVTPDNLLPTGETTSCVLDPEDPEDVCYLAGDTRVNVFPGLTGLHTLFVREHNRIARVLASLNPTWSHERLFDEARKIVGAELQVITYNEWLPVIIGTNAMTLYGLNSGGGYIYVDETNPTLSNVFSTAAFRFGHTMIPKSMSFENGNVPLTDMYNRPSFVRKNIESVFEGLLDGNNQNVDAWYSDEMRNHLFETTSQTGLDIVALNIHRGRDHGLPAYNAWRQYCNLPNVTNPRDAFGGRAGVDIERTYASPDDIDLYTGGVSEVPVQGAAVGSLYACLIGEQFADLKYGDSYWYENPDPVKGFTTEQIATLDQVSLSRIICDNIDIDRIQPQPFLLPTIGNNQEVDCSSSDIPSLDLSLWGPQEETTEPPQPTQPSRTRPTRPPRPTGGRPGGRTGGRSGGNRG